MKTFITHSSVGKILATYTMPETEVPLVELGDGYLVFDVPQPASNHYIENGEIFEKAIQPSQFHYFDYANKEWVDPRVLVDFKEAKWNEIKAARATAISANLATPYGAFDADPSSSLNIIKAVLLAQTLTNAGEPVAIDYTLADNTVVTLSAEQMTQVGLILGEREQQVRNKATDLRAQIDACTSKEQLESIAW